MLILQTHDVSKSHLMLPASESLDIHLNFVGINLRQDGPKIKPQFSVVVAESPLQHRL